MKKLLILLSFCLITVLSEAQQTDDFNTYTSTAYNKMHVAYLAKDYAKAIAINKEWFTKFEQQPDSFKRANPGYLSGMYYNLACFAALSGNKAAALTNLKLAARYGYSGYANMVNDTDLVSLHGDKVYESILEQVREKGDYGYLLKKAGPYNKKDNVDLPIFTYQSADAPELVAFRKTFNLDSIAGNGDEISKFKNLLYWVHNIVRHDGNSSNPKLKNAIDLITVCKKDKRGVNCRMMATILKDAYQAEGFNARMVTCMPKDTADFDFHVINVVWSKTLNKWVWMDPTFNAYVADDKGNLLSIEEVRQKLISGAPLVLNDDANWNNQIKQTKEDYLGRYMSKNLYWLECSVKNEWDLETRTISKTIDYVNLYPGNFSTIQNQPKKVMTGMVEYATNNPAYFWQKPE